MLTHIYLQVLSEANQSSVSHVYVGRRHVYDHPHDSCTKHQKGGSDSLVRKRSRSKSDAHVFSGSSSNRSREGEKESECVEVAEEAARQWVARRRERGMV